MNRSNILRVFVAGALLSLIVIHAPVFAQNAPDPGVIRLDPALDQIISPDARLDILTGNDFGISEGPVWVPQGQSGYLLFSDIVANVIYKWTPETHMYSVFLDNSGYPGTPEAIDKMSQAGFIGRGGPGAKWYIYNFGSNGITLDRQGRVVYVAQGDRAVIRLEKNGTRTVLADRYEGKRFNRPNDIIVKSDGAIYFSDPRPRVGAELPYSAVFMVKDGKVHLLANNFQPNGLAFSPDEKILYLNGVFGIRPGQPASAHPGIWQYDVQPDDTIANGRLFIDMSADKTPGGPDGMKVDRAGNVYDTGPGGIWIMSPQGKHLGTIVMPKMNSDRATNLAFGDPDYKTLYITDRLSLDKIRLNIAGIAPGPPQN